jgi:hypothetical protein
MRATAQPQIDRLSQLQSTSASQRRIHPGECLAGNVKPTALLITMGKYRGVAKRLRDVKAAHDLPGVDLCIKWAGDFDEIPTLMKSAVDLVALDGHGCKNGYYGRQCERQFCPEYLRGEDGAGIVAPIVTLGFCWGGEDPFISALEGSLGRSQAAFLGRTDETKDL